MSILLLCMVMGISSVFFRVKHPLSMGALVLVLSGFSCMIIGLEVSSWFGYVVFLIYVGALLVMFAYVAALAPNPRFGLNVFHFFFVVGSVVVCLVMVMIYWPFGEDEGLMMGSLGESYSGGHIVMSSFDGSFVLVALGGLLLLILVAVCKICRFYKGPLRLF